MGKNGLNSKGGKSHLVLGACTYSVFVGSLGPRM